MCHRKIPRSWRYFNWEYQITSILTIGVCRSVVQLNIYTSHTNAQQMYCVWHEKKIKSIFIKLSTICQTGFSRSVQWRPYDVTKQTVWHIMWHVASTDIWASPCFWCLFSFLSRVVLFNWKFVQTEGKRENVPRSRRRREWAQRRRIVAAIRGSRIGWWVLQITRFLRKCSEILVEHTANHRWNVGWISRYCTHRHPKLSAISRRNLQTEAVTRT